MSISTTKCIEELLPTRDVPIDPDPALYLPTNHILTSVENYRFFELFI